MVSIQLEPEYGYVIAVLLGLWFQQAIIFVIPIAMQRRSTKIHPPVLYPNDKLIKDLNLSESQVDKYMCAQVLEINIHDYFYV